jgi:DNA-binding MarR family transcriptional regulator
MTMKENIGFLLNDTARLYRRAFNERARDTGVTGLQWRLLVYLRRNEGIHQAAMADLLEVEPITLSRMVDRLDEAGFVERKPDPNDRRARRLFLTNKATTLMADIRFIVDDLLEQSLQGFSKKDKQLLYDLVEQVQKNLSRKESICQKT